MENVKISKPEIKKLLEGCPNSGMAEIALKFPKRTGSITIRDYTLTDEEGNLTHRPFVDSNGNSKIVKITKQKRLNLSRDSDRLEYMQILNHPEFTTGPNPVLVVKNLEEEADNYIKDKDLESQVNGIIQKLGGKELKSFCRVLLIKFNEGSTDSSIKRSLYEVAEGDPSYVLNAWEDPERPLKEMIRVGIVKKIFTATNGRWMCKDIPTGTSFEQTVEWLKDNVDLQPKLRKEIFAK